MLSVTLHILEWALSSKLSLHIISGGATGESGMGEDLDPHFSKRWVMRLTIKCNEILLSQKDKPD